MCMYVRTCSRVCGRMPAYVRVCAYARPDAYAHKRASASMCAYVRVCTSVCALGVCVLVCEACTCVSKRGGGLTAVENQLVTINYLNCYPFNQC